MTDLTNVPVRNINDLELAENIPLDASVLDAVKIPVGGLTQFTQGEALSLKQLREVLVAAMPGWVPSTIDDLIARSDAEVQKMLEKYLNAIKDVSVVLDAIQGQINESHLALELNKKIDIGTLAKDAASQAQASANAAYEAAKAAADKASAEGKAAIAYAEGRVKEAEEVIAQAELNIEQAQQATAQLILSTEAQVNEAKAQAQQLTEQARQDAQALITALDQKFIALNGNINTEISNLNAGLTQETTARQEGLAQITTTLNAYKAVVDDNLAVLFSKNETIVSDAAALATQVNALKSQVALVEGKLPLKLDASVIQNYYTKAQSEANATSVAAGEITKYDSQLVIGGANLFSFADTKAGYNSATGAITSGAAAHQTMQTLIPTLNHTHLVYQVWNPSLITNTSNTNRIAFFKADGSFLNAVGLPQLNGTAYQTLIIAIPSAAAHVRLGAIVGAANGGRDASVKVKFEFGNKATDWSPSPLDTQASLDANATAIQNTDTEVSRVNGEVLSQGQSITTLQNNLNVTNNEVAKKANATVVDSINSRVTTTETGLTSVGNRTTALENSVNHATTGLSTKASTSALNTTNSNVSAIDGTVKGHTTQLTNLATSIQTINGTLSNKLDASLINNYYTKGQTDAKAAEIAAGKVEEFNATLRELPTQGENLIPNGTFDATLPSYGFTSIPSDSEGVPEGCPFPYVTRLANRDHFLDTRKTTNIPCKAGDVYEISVLVACAIGTAQFNLYTYRRNSATTTSNLVAARVGGVPAAEGATWKRLTVRWTVPAHATHQFFVPFLQIDQNSPWGTVWYATDWSCVNVSAGAKAQDTADATANALTVTNAEVERVDGRVTATNSNVTALTGRVSTVEGAVATKADASALTALTTRVGNAEGVNTSQGSAITTLQNTVNHSTTGLATKASTAALTATNSEVTRINGVVTGHTNQLTQLSSDITAINGTLATKANASALNDIYTKTQADAKATSIAAGEIAKYDASLVIGGTNLLKNSEGVFTPNTSKTDNYVVYQNSTVDMINGKEYTLSGETNGEWSSSHSPSTESNKAVLWLVGNGINTIISNSDVGTKGRTFVWDNPSGTYLLRLNSYRANNSIWFKKIKIESGNKRTDWTPNTNEVQSAISANATAITDTNAEVSRVDGRVTTESSRITSLTGRVDTVVGDLAKKADASALSSLTTRVESEEGKSTSQGTAITALQNTVNHATTGLSTKASSAALTAVDNKVTAVDGRVTTTNSNVATLSGRVSTVEGAVATKADVSALNNIYTKTEADAKATSLAAGEISKYDASLVIGGTNLFSFAGAVAGYINPVNGEVVTASATHQTMTALIPLGSHKSMTYQVWNPAAIRNTSNINRIAFFRADGSFLSVTALPELNGTTYQTTLIQIPDAATHARLGVLAGPANGGRDVNIKIKIEFGNKATDWSEADSAIVDSLNVNATAITNTNAEVSRVDGRVTTESSRITALTGRVSTVEGGLTTKADSSALVNYSTKTATDEAIAAATTALKASLGLYALPTDKDTSQQNKWARITLRKTQPYIADSAVPDYSYIGTYPEHSEGYFAEGATTTLPIDNSINYYRTLINVAAASTINLGNLMGDDAHAIYVDGKEVYRKTAYSTNPCSFEVTAGDHVVDIVVNNGAGGAGFSSTITMSSQVSSMYAPKLTGVLIGNKAEASAIQTTNSEVSRINGVVAGHSTQLTNLSASIAGKADTTALNALTTRVTDNEGEITSQSTKLTKLDASIGNTISHILATSRNGSYRSGGIGAGVYTPKLVRAAVFSRGMNLVTWRVDGTLGSVQSFDTYGNSASAIVALFNAIQALAVNTYFTLVGFDNVGGNSAFQANTDLKNFITANGGSEEYYATWNANNLPIFTSMVGTGTGTGIQHSFNSNVTGDWIKYPITFIGGIPEGMSGTQPVDASKFASASALSTLDTKVGLVDGRVSTQAEQLLVLTSDNTNNKNALQVQAKVIDGVKASYMVKMETNGVVGGFGMIQESGAMGVVFTSFGVSADSFFIGAPAGGKKPFIVSTYSQIINGVTYPAGTWIDTALIANATIGGAKIVAASIDTAQIADGAITNAKIENLAVTGAKIANATIGTAQIADLAITAAKIENAAITTAKIGDLQVDTIKIKDNAVTSLLEVQRTQQRVEQNFPYIPANTLTSIKIKVVLMSGLSKNNRYLVYWRGVIGAGMSSRLSNTPPYYGWGRKRVYFGSSSSTDIVGSRILVETNQLNGNYIRWYENNPASTGNATQWNVAEGIVDETGSLCLWVDIEWKTFQDNIPADTLYGYLYMSELSVLISEFKK